MRGCKPRGISKSREQPIAEGAPPQRACLAVWHEGSVPSHADRGLQGPGARGWLVGGVRGPDGLGRSERAAPGVTWQALAQRQ